MRHFLDLSDAGGDAIAAMINDALDRKAARAGWPKGKHDADAPLAGRVHDEREVQATTETQDDLGFTGVLAACEGADLGTGGHDAYVALELRPAWYRFADGSEAITDADFGWQVVGPLEVEVERS